MTLTQMAGITVMKARTNRVFSWGSGFMGQLGHGDRSSFEWPRNVQTMDGNLVVQLAAGPGDHMVALSGRPCRTSQRRHMTVSCVLAETGDVYSWGSGVCGQLGHGHLRNESTPQKVGSAGVSHTCEIEYKGRSHFVHMVHTFMS